ncbi:hypothetical protein GGI20_000187 [Coemansia sp. BCRC 34301]|nr:hypothetical protein GGI20_000187 [Coemansia sp. BCRC 34301]
MTLGRLEHHWEAQVPREQGILTIHDFGLRQDMADVEPNAGGDDGLALDPAAAQAVRNIGPTIVLNGVSLGRMLVESLLLPAISSACGSLVARLPFFRRGLSHFSKVILGGCTYFVVKDLIRILYKYLLFRSRSSRYLKGRKRL